MTTRHLNNIIAAGAVLTDTAKAYVTRIHTSGASWLDTTAKASMIEQHILLGALSEMDFPFGTIVVPPGTADQMRSVATWNPTQYDRIVRETAKRCCQVLYGQIDCTVLVPMVHNGHFGLLIAKDYKIYWSDSLGWEPFRGEEKPVLEVLKDI